MDYQSLENRKFYRLSLEPRGGGLVLNNARVRCVINQLGERHLIVDDDRYIAECQFKVEPSGALLRFDYNGSWIGNGDNISNTLKESQ